MVRNCEASRFNLGLSLVLLVIGIFLPAIGGCCSLHVKQAPDNSKVILVTPNLDDDDGDGKSDAYDDMINGPRDREDLTPIEVPISVVNSTFVFEGAGAELYRVVEIDKSGQEWATVYVEAKGPRTESSSAVLEFIGETSNSENLEFAIDVKPFILTSSVDPVVEVFISGTEESLPFIKQLRSIFAEIPNAPKLTVVGGKNRKVDIWMQDTTEIGFFDDTSIYAALKGLRAKLKWVDQNDEQHPKHLDQYFMEVFFGRDRCGLKIGESLPKRDFIDHYGNLELTPPILGANSISYPQGRILVVRQNERTMQDSVMEFLEAQGEQWPPIILDGSSSFTGHVDELVNFVPTENGFKTIIASPLLGRELLEKLARDGHGDKVILEGKKDWETTVERILNDSELMSHNDSAIKAMLLNREKLKRELNLAEDDIIDLPVFYTRYINIIGFYQWPNPVNALVIDNHYVLSKPHGPVINGEDPIELAYRKAFANSGAILHFVDIFDVYSAWGGDVHCGTNAVRHRTRY